MHHTMHLLEALDGLFANSLETMIGCCNMLSGLPAMILETHLYSATCNK